MNLLKSLRGILVGKSPESTSPTTTVDMVDALKVFRTSLLVGASAMLTDLLQNISPEMFGDYKLLATVVLTGLGELSLRFLKNNKVKE